MADPIQPTRDRLALFLPTIDLIRAFERLFAVAGQITPDQIKNIISSIDDVYSLASNSDVQSYVALGNIDQSEQLSQMANAIDRLNIMQDDITRIEQKLNEIGAMINAIQYP